MLRPIQLCHLQSLLVVTRSVHSARSHPDPECPVELVTKKAIGGFKGETPTKLELRSYMLTTCLNKVEHNYGGSRP